MQTLKSPSSAVLCHQPRGTKHLSSATPNHHVRFAAVPQRRARHHAQQCNAFHPWQRILQWVPIPDQHPSGQAPAPAVDQTRPLSRLADGLLKPATALQQDKGSPPAAIISGAGGGIFFFWQLGEADPVSCAVWIVRIQITMRLLPKQATDAVLYHQVITHYVRDISLRASCQHYLSTLPQLKCRQTTNLLFVCTVIVTGQ